MRLLSKGHAVVTKAASTDETRYVLNGVYLEETEKGLKATATDGCILATVEDIDKAMGAEDFPVNVMPKDAENGAVAAIVPTAAFNDIVKAVPKRVTLPVLERVAVVMGKATSTMGVTDLQNPTIKVAQNIDGVYPKYEQIIPRDKPALAISFDPEYMLKVCQIAKSFGLRGMKMEFTTPESPVKVSGKRDGQSLTIVLMPLRG